MPQSTPSRWPGSGGQAVDRRRFPASAPAGGGVQRPAWEQIGIFDDSGLPMYYDPSAGGSTFSLSDMYGSGSPGGGGGFSGGGQLPPPTGGGGGGGGGYGGGFNPNNDTGVQYPWEMSQTAVNNLQTPGPHFMPGVGNAAKSEVSQSLDPLVSDMRAGIDTQSRLRAAGLDADLNQTIGRLDLQDYSNDINAQAPYNMFRAGLSTLPLQLSGGILNSILTGAGGLV